DAAHHLARTGTAWHWTGAGPVSLRSRRPWPQARRAAAAAAAQPGVRRAQRIGLLPDAAQTQRPAGGLRAAPCKLVRRARVGPAGAACDRASGRRSRATVGGGASGRLRSEE